jgi:hypothetical protein
MPGCGHSDRRCGTVRRYGLTSDAVGTVVIVVAVVVLLATWVTWTATRMDRLHGRVDKARAALDAALVRRAAALQALVDRSPDALGGHAEQLRRVARASLAADPATREGAENDLSRELHGIPGGLDTGLMADLSDAAGRVALARRFYNDAVRDTTALRRRRLPRLLRLAGRAPMPAFFEIDDTLPPVASGRGSAT